MIKKLVYSVVGKSLVFYVRFNTLFSTTPMCHPDIYHLDCSILRFTHHIQAIKFSLVYRVTARKGLLAAERLRTSSCYDNIAST